MKHENQTIINLITVDVYNKLYGLTTHHPLVTVVDLRDATQLVNNAMWKYGIYAICLKNNKTCRMRYGMKEYDYQSGTVVTFAPGAEVNLDYTEEELSSDAIGLLFHPESHTTSASNIPSTSHVCSRKKPDRHPLNTGRH